MKALQHAMPFVRRELGGRLRLRRIPDLQLRLDDTVQRGTRVLQLLAEIEAGGIIDTPPPIEESLPTPMPHVPIPPASEPRRRSKKRKPADRSGRAARR